MTSGNNLIVDYFDYNNHHNYNYYDNNYYHQRSGYSGIGSSFYGLW